MTPSTLNQPPPRWVGWTLAMLASAIVWLALFTFAGCGGGHKRPRPEPPAPASPTVAATPARALACWSYTYGSGPADFAAMRDAGIVATMDYAQVGICERTAASGLGIIAPFYYGRADTFDVIEQITRDQARNFEACRARVIAVYPVDEPDVQKLPGHAVEMMIASAGRAFPTVPRLVTFGEKSSLPQYAGLTLRGAELYSRSWRDMARVRKRIVDASVVPVVRGFDNGGKWFGDWSDADNAAFVRRLGVELPAGPAGAMLFYTFADNLNAKPDTGWRDLPLTRAAIAEVCR